MITHKLPLKDAAHGFKIFNNKEVCIMTGMMQKLRNGVQAVIRPRCAQQTCMLGGWRQQQSIVVAAGRLRQGCPEALGGRGGVSWLQTGPAWPWAVPCTF